MTVAMDYFRRPVLAGNTLTHETFATVRGDIRRNDIDGGSTVPYFPGVTGSQTLIVIIDGGSPVTVSFTGSPPGSLANILANINTALGITATAFDADGTVAIQSSTVGSLGSVEITGGTAAAAIGFDITANVYKSFGGEIQATPEARRGNPYGTAFLSRGENFTAESVQRGLARLASNLDVLHSDLSRNDAVIRKVNYTTSDNTLLTLSTATDELFTGLGFLNNASVQEDLAPYFHLIDPVTKHIAQSRVVAVVRGAPGGSPPFSNASSWSGGGAAGNILGVILDKVSSTAITSIVGGRVVKVGVDVSAVQPGDFAEITGATNNTQWNNNGNRWVVEAVLSSNSVALRPMSKSELALVGFSPADVQPIIELNGHISGGESYGNIVIRTGTYCSGVGAGISVYLKPPMPTGASYDLYVSQPISARAKKVSDDRSSASLPFKDLVSDLSGLFDGTISGLTASKSSGNCVITSGTIRWRGKTYHLPGATYIPSAFTNNATNWVYWDDFTTSLVITANVADFTNLYDASASTNKGNLVAQVNVVSGAIQSVTPANRLVADAARTVTVGFGGQFADLDSAIDYLNAFSNSFSETVSASGSFPHYEIELVGDATYSGALIFTPGLIIRGATPNTLLTLNGSGLEFGGTSIVVENLNIATSGTVPALIEGALSNTFSVRIINVVQTAGHMVAMVSDDGSSNPTNIYAESSSFIVDKNVVKGTPAASAGDIRLINCKFAYNSGATPQIISDSAAATWSGQVLFIQGCTFSGNWLTASSNSLLVNAVSATSRVVVEDSVFTLGAHTFTARNFMTVTAGKCMFKGNRITGGMASTITGSTATSVLNNYIECVGNANENAIDAGYVIGNEIVQFDNGDTGTQGGSTGIHVLVEAIGNYLHGPFLSAIGCSTSGLKVHGNRIEMADGAVDLTFSGIRLNGCSNVSIVGNSVKYTGTITNGAKGVQFINTTVNEVVIADNNFVFSGQTTGFSGANSGVEAAISATHTNVSITGNTIVCESGGATNNNGINVPFIDNVVISGNVINLPLTGGGTAVGIAIGNNFPSITVTGNHVTCTGTPIDGGSIPQETWIISGNTFISLTSGAATSASNLGGTVTNNRFDYASPATSCKITFSRGRISGNYVHGSATVNPSSNEIIFDDNQITGDFVLAAGSAIALYFRDNLIGGNFDGATNTPSLTDLLVEGNHINGIFNFTPTAFGGSAIFTLGGNRVIGATTITFSGVIHLTASHNYFADNVTVTLSGGNSLWVSNENATGKALTVTHGTSVASSAVLSGNILDGVFITASRVDYTGNKSVSNAHFTRGFGTKNTSANIVGNVITNGEILTNHFHSHISHNELGQVSLFAGLLHRNSEGGGTCECIGNNVTGFIDIENAPASGSTLDSAVCSGNFVTLPSGSTTLTVTATNCEVTGNTLTNAAGTAALAVSSTSCHVSGNTVTPLHGATISTAGTYQYVTNNTLYSTSNTLADNHSTSLTVADHTYADVSGNWIYGRYIIGTTTSFGLQFTKNFCYTNATSNTTPCLLLTGGFQNFVIAENFLDLDMGSITTDGFCPVVLFSGNFQILYGRVTNNRFYHETFSTHYTSNGTVVMFLKSSGSCFRTIFTSNIFNKQADTTIDGHTIAMQYIDMVAASDTLLLGNLMDANGTTGAGVRRGDTAYTAGVGTFSVPE